jgi:hypothetical protein
MPCHFNGSIINICIDSVHVTEGASRLLVLGLQSLVVTVTHCAQTSRSTDTVANPSSLEPTAQVDRAACARAR